MDQPTAVDNETSDQLTGCTNHRHFRFLLESTVLPQARQRSDPLTLALCDIDHFLEVNETYGHAFGDQLLTRVARLLGAVLPDTALIARYGGGGFVAALPDTRLDAALPLWQEFRRAAACR